MGAGEGLDYAERHGIAALFLTPRPDSDTGPVTVRASRMFEAGFPAVARAAAH